MNERRRSERIKVSFPVECCALPSQNFFYTVTKDLSQLGLRIVSSDFIPKNNFLKLHINFINKVLDLKARVVWCNKEAKSERYATGLEFVEVDSVTQRELSRFLNSASEQS